MSDLSYLSDRMSVKGDMCDNADKNAIRDDIGGDNGDNNDICDSVNISSINTGDTGDHKSSDKSDNKSTGSR